MVVNKAGAKFKHALMPVQICTMNPNNTFYGFDS